MIEEVRSRFGGGSEGNVNMISGGAESSASCFSLSQASILKSSLYVDVVFSFSNPLWAKADH